MKLTFVELAGFRGFRNQIRVEFGSGFSVICGRNGLGKSTLCDAVEFALIGAIDKYRVEKAAGESVSDYVWWRGDEPEVERGGNQADRDQIIDDLAVPECAGTERILRLARHFTCDARKLATVHRRLSGKSWARDWIGGEFRNLGI